MGDAVYGLVLPGGGSKGSWQAGAILYMAKHDVLPHGPDWLGCTSVGAVNGVGIASYSKSEFKEAAAEVVRLWREKVTKTSDIWLPRFPLGLPALWKPSYGDNWPLEALLKEVVDPGNVGKDIKIRFTAVDLESGELKEYDEGDMAVHGMKPVLASSSFPGVFPPVEIDDRYETDGGVRDIAPLGSAIKAGCTHITVLALGNHKDLERVDRAELQNTLAVGKRVIDIMSHEILENDIKACLKINRWLRKGWLSEESGLREVELDLLSPSKPLGNSLDFSGELMTAQIDQGYEDAKRYYGG
jgi:NTE family protein